MRRVTIGLVLIALAVVLGLLVKGSPSGLDVAIGQALGLRTSENPLLVTAAQAVTRLGDPGMRPVLIVLVLAVLSWRRHWHDALAMLLGSLASVAMISLMKGQFGRVRPDLIPWLDQPTNASFPSGHAGNTLAILLLFALLAGGRWRVALALALAAAVGVSRVMLGVHWASDVVGGWLAGGGVALVAYGLARYRALPAPAQTR